MLFVEETLGANIETLNNSLTEDRIWIRIPQILSKNQEEITKYSSTLYIGMDEVFSHYTPYRPSSMENCHGRRPRMQDPAQ